MSEDVRTVLMRLRRKMMGQRRFFFSRLAKSAVGVAADRPLGESNVCLIAINAIDKELRKFPKPAPPIRKAKP